jgi:hypothetical protein
MAWGWQARHVGTAWAGREVLGSLLNEVKAGSCARAGAYDLFKGRVKGLGPSYFTKLIYFFSPVEDRYIMDQWTGASVNLLMGMSVVKMSRPEKGGASPLNTNTGGNYERFCEVIDELTVVASRQLGRAFTGEDIEQHLFSHGKKAPDGRRQEEGAWRAYVREHTT